MKAKNPKCIFCGKSLQSVFKQVVNPKWTGDFREADYLINGDLIGHGYAGKGYFCSLRCAWKWALRRIGHDSGKKGESE